MSLTFVRESNLIEGIHEVSQGDIEAHDRLWQCEYIGVAALEDYVHGIQGKPLRREVGMNVRVGDHLPPAGGPHIESALAVLLDRMYDGDLTSFEAHVEYETLHPFLDGNGRSGRALWAWQMQRDGLDPFALPFLHRWYYQTLSNVRSSPPTTQVDL